MIDKKAVMPTRAKREQAAPKVQITLSDVGFGTMRSSGTYIAALLQLEGDRYSQIEVISGAMDDLGITLEEVAEYRRNLQVEAD